MNSSEELKQEQALKERSEKIFKRQKYAIIWLAIGMLALLVAAGYAWFTVSATSRVCDMAVYINSPTGLTLATAYDAKDEDWGNHVEYADIVTESSPLKPVTWSQNENCFKAIRYGLDGRQLSNFRALSDEANANRTDDNQYYVFSTFYAKTDTTCRVSLADAITMNDGEYGAGTYVIGSPVWNGSSHVDEGRGSQYAIRLGFKVVQIDPNLGTDVGEQEFYIYEPNADTHVDKTTQLLNTRSIDGTDTLVDSDHLIVQTTSSWEEANPVEKDVTIKTLGEFTGSSELFEIEVGQKYRIDLYIWVEGQDLDCYGLPNISELTCNIQFKTDQSQQSGLEEIPD